MASTSPIVSSCGCPGLVAEPHALRDSWSKTFYTPLLVKQDAAALLASVPADEEATLDVDVSLTCKAQFDQVGAYVHCAEGVFIKAGLEFADGEPRVSVVVTNGGFSDWSTQAWHFDDASARTASVRLRLHKLLRPQGACVLVEIDTSGLRRACPAAGGARWTFVRIAPLHAPAGAPWGMGAFAAAPVAAGTRATFSHVSVGPRAELSHESDASAMTSAAAQ